MKIINYLLSIVYFGTIVVVLSGCKYDVAEPQWGKVYNPPASSKIDSIVPSPAMPGVNTITIYGSNFSFVKDSVKVTFSGQDAEIISNTATSVTVRRPSLVSDTCTVRAYTLGSFVEPGINPYKIYPVSVAFGNFNDNIALNIAAIDNAQNIYVIDQANLNRIYKILPDGSNFYARTKNLLDTASSRQVLPRAPRDAVVGPDGRLYLVGAGTTAGNSNILAVGLDTPYTWRIWRNVGKSVRFGDFDANGYYYTGGTRTDLVIVAPDSSNRLAGMYATDTIHAIRAYSGFLYVAASLSSGEKGIWRHSISAGGVLSAKDLYVDFKSDTTISGRAIRSIAMSSNGTMYISTDNVNPLLIVDPLTKKIDYFYKNIVPSLGKFFFWGNADYAYLMSGAEWKFFKIDMGTTGAPK
jgi:hypothetical protein